MTPPPITPASVQVPGDLAAPVIVDFDVHALHMGLIERAAVPALGSPWSKPGVYVLFGTPGGEPVQVYVGKATKLKERLATHRTKPKFPWWRALAIVRDTTAGFNSAEIGYLEGRIASELKGLPAIALAADRYDLDTTLPAYMLLQLDAFVPTILAALRIVGLDLRAPDPQSAEDVTILVPAAGKGAAVPGTVADLLTAGLLTAGTQLVFFRKGQVSKATVTAAGSFWSLASGP